MPSRAAPAPGAFRSTQGIASSSARVLPGAAECRRRNILNTDLSQCAEDGFLVALAETAAISVPSATIISNYSSFTCFDLDSKLAPMTMYSIVDTIIARQSASGRMAIVGYPDYVPAAHDALARAAREGVAVLQFDNDDRIIYRATIRD